MAILCLATSIDDLQTRISQIVVGYTHAKEPVTAAQVRPFAAVSKNLPSRMKVMSMADVSKK